MLAFGYVSISLLTGKSFTWKGFKLASTRFFYIMPIIFNSYALFSIMLSDFTQIGSFNEDILSQGVSSLLPLSIFILILGFNAALIYINIHKPSEIWLHKLAAYIFVVIAVEICVSIYSFYVVGGIESIRWCFGIFHLAFIVLSIWSYRRFNANKIYLRITAPHLLLILVSVGVFTMVYVPHGLYNLYGDSSVILGNTLSITSRESLQPYFTADSFYSPIMGFISVLFVAITGCNNLLLACNLPFLLGALLLPFVTYHFLKSFVTDDPRIAVLGVLIVAIMDGLAIILLPIYYGNITENTIHWYISSPTRSLYSSNIYHLWLTPYKVLAVASAIAACSILDKQRVINYVMAGGLFFMSFINLRYAFLTPILLIFLFGLKKINVRGLFLFVLSFILFAGFSLPVHLYKQLSELSKNLANQGLINESFISYFDNPIKSFVLQDNYFFIALIVLMSILGIMFLSSRTNLTVTKGTLFTSFFSKRNFPVFSVKIGKRKKNLCFSTITLLLCVLLICIFFYILVNVYFPDMFAIFRSNSYFSTLNAILVRYHVLLGFFIIGLLALKFPRRIALTIVAIFLFFYFGARFSGSTTALPLVFTILAIPFINLCIKYRKKIAVIFLLVFIFLGIFSATFYSATVTKPVNSSYSDLPDLLEILLEESEINKVAYSPSHYKYFVDRIVKQSHMRLSSNSSCNLYIIDKNFMNATLLGDMLNDFQFTQKFVGERFILLEKR